jgi:predicted amidohydrolase
MALGSAHGVSNALSVVIVQMHPISAADMDDVRTNVETLCAWMDRAQVGFPGVDLIVFPEGSLQGYHVTKWLDTVVDLSGPEVGALAAHCKRLGVWAHFSLLERHPQGEKPFNTSLVINSQGTIALRYVKVNPWVPIEECTPGDEFCVVDGPKASRLGVITCYDGDLPEAAREVAMMGANVLIRGAAYMEPYGEPWVFTNQARAWENLMYVVAVNQVGTDPMYTYTGRSMIVNLDGRIITELSRDAEGMTKADLYPALVDAARQEYGEQNHLYNLTHRGHSALSPGGRTTNPYRFYRDWK